MNEIEKMYENGGIKADRIVCSRGFDNCIDNDFNCHYHNEKPCKDATKIYPPFTAEKQLNIIKFLGETRDFYTCGRFCSILNCEGDSVESLQDNFEESLANLINTLWRNLTSEEKKQIKEILE